MASVNREIETRKSIVWLNKTTYESFKKATLLSRAVMLPLPSVAMPLMSNGQCRVRLIVFPYAGRRSGIEQVAQFYSQFAQTEEVEQIEFQDFIAQGDKVLVFGHYKGRVKSTYRTQLYQRLYSCGDIA